MLAKKFRLPVSTFPAKARTLHQGQYLKIKFSSNRLFYNRLGVIITKKTASGAVQRNRIRRKIFNFFEKAPGFSPTAKEGRDLLVVIRPIKLDLQEEDKLTEELKPVIDTLTND